MLALGNGSPDLGSTINAILLWNESVNDNSNFSDDHTHAAAGPGGWAMSLGSLTGGGMFVGTVVSGLIIQSCNGIPCRGAFLRDVSMYALSILMVWRLLESQRVTRTDVLILLAMWVGYVTVVFIADMYHRKVTLPRLHAEGKKRRESLKMEKLKMFSATAENTSVYTSNNTKATGNDADVNEMTSLQNDFASYGLEEADVTNASLSSDYKHDLDKPLPRLSMTDRFAMLMSNYDPASVKFDLSSKCSTISNADSDTTTIHNVMNQIHSIRRTSLAMSANENLFGSIQQNDTGDKTYETLERLHSFPEGLEEEESIVDEGEERPCVVGMCLESYQEIVYQASCYWENHFVDESSGHERFGFLLELPITIIRTVSFAKMRIRSHFFIPKSSR